MIHTTGGSTQPTFKPPSSARAPTTISWSANQSEEDSRYLQQPCQPHDLHNWGGNHTTRHGGLCHPSPGHAGGLLQKNPHLVAEMQSRARGAFASNSRLLTARTPLRPRMLLHQALVRQSTLWACETRPVQDTLLRSTTPQNAGGGRRPGEDWVDWNKRSVRCLPAQNRGERWSTYSLKQIWRLWGHAIRTGGATKGMLLWRDLNFWRTEQRKDRHCGARHASRFNPQLDTERQISAVAGPNWAEVAVKRGEWQALEQRFVDMHDPPWVTGKQPQLQNLAPIYQHAQGGNKGLPLHRPPALTSPRPHRG